MGIVIVIGVLSYRLFFYHPKPPPLNGIPQDLYIKMTLTGTLLPVRGVLEIHHDGSITYQEESLQPVPQPIIAKKVGKISEAKLREILNLFYKNNFFAWDGTHFYFCSKNPILDVDVNHITITLYVNGKAYTAGRSGSAGPKGLREIEKALWELEENLKDEVIPETKNPENSKW